MSGFAELELLDFQGVYSMPGAMDTGRNPPPKPFMDFRDSMPKWDNGLNHLYWLKKDIEEWISSILYETCKT